jgi:hypothetical protein
MRSGGLCQTWRPLCRLLPGGKAFCGGEHHHSEHARTQKHRGGGHWVRWKHCLGSDREGSITTRPLPCFARLFFVGSICKSQRCHNNPSLIPESVNAKGLPHCVLGGRSSAMPLSTFCPSRQADSARVGHRSVLCSTGGLASARPRCPRLGEIHFGVCTRAQSGEGPSTMKPSTLDESKALLHPLLGGSLEAIEGLGIEELVSEKCYRNVKRVSHHVR